MILGNFLGVDPEHETSGLSRNNRLQEEVWREFAGRPNDLRQVADAIAGACAVLPNVSVQSDELMEGEVLPEGRLLTRLHLLHERNRALVERKRQQTLARTGRLACEVCDFDFARVYGKLGDGFAECHHLVPLSELPGVRATRLSDLAIVCANCHRILHRTRPTITIAELRKLVLRSLIVTPRSPG
jgi:5-methylcytosine-specific restriction protein A